MGAERIVAFINGLTGDKPPGSASTTLSATTNRSPLNTVGGIPAINLDFQSDLEPDAGEVD
jgi:hypothetical protein